jgi:NitT/TauT family transport system substrate-binding protein
MGFDVSRRTALIALATSFASLGAAPARAADALRVAKAVAQSPGYLPLDVGMKRGLFAMHDVAVEELNFAGGAKVAQAIAAGSVDLALSAGPDMAFAAKGAPQIAIASISSSPAFIGITVGARSPIRNADDLRGRKIGVASQGLATWLVDELNKAKGWTGSDQATPVVIGGSPTANLAALETGQVDATINGVVEGWRLEEQHKGRLLLEVADYVGAFQLYVMFAGTALVQRNPGAIRRFLAGWFESVAYMRSHKAETIEAMKEVIGYSPAIAERCYDELIPKLSLDGRFDRKALAALFASFADLKILPPSADLSKLYTERFLPHAT